MCWSSCAAQGLSWSKTKHVAHLVCSSTLFWPPVWWCDTDLGDGPGCRQVLKRLLCGRKTLMWPSHLLSTGKDGLLGQVPRLVALEVSNWDRDPLPSSPRAEWGFGEGTWDIGSLLMKVIEHPHSLETSACRLPQLWPRKLNVWINPCEFKLKQQGMLAEIFCKTYTLFSFEENGDKSSFWSAW